MPSGTGGMGTGSDTRMYNPRSESSRMYSTDESRGDYRHGIGDPEDMERQRDKQQAQEEADKTKDLPHIKIEVEHQGPDLQEPLPPLPGAENEEPQMDEDENAVGAEVSQMTGMPGSMGAQLDQAVGARTGTGSAMGGYRPMLATGEPMDLAWRLLKGLEERQVIDDDREYLRDRAHEEKYPKGHHLHHIAPEVNWKTAHPSLSDATLAAGAEPEHVSDWSTEDTVWDPLSGKRRVVSIAEGFQDENRSPAKNSLLTRIKQVPMRGALNMKTRDAINDIAARARHAYDHGEPTFYDEGKYESQQDDIMARREKALTRMSWADANRANEQAQAAMAAGTLQMQPVPQPSDFTQSPDPTQVMMGEPIDGAWSTLLKRVKPWSAPQFDQFPSVRQPASASKRMADIKQRNLSTYGGKGGLDEAKSPLKRTHGGRGGAHAAHEFVAPYHQYLSTQAHRRHMGGIGLPGHGRKEVGRGNPKITIHRLPGESRGAGSATSMPKVPGVSQGPKISPMAIKAELEEIQDLLLKAKSPADYLHFSQLRSMLRRVKDLMERKESRLKATANRHGGKGEAGHRDGGTTTNHGGTENLKPEDDTKNWGASSAHLVARGSGRSA